MFKRLIGFDVDPQGWSGRIYISKTSGGTARELLSSPVDLPPDPTFGGPTRQSVPRCVFYIRAGFSPTDSGEGDHMDEAMPCKSYWIFQRENGKM